MDADDNLKKPMEFALRQFQLPTASHPQSRLLQLPAEVRLITLRHLMLEPEIICIRTSRQQDHGYSTQLLRCCQQLYKEGVHVLYEENTLEVRCKTEKKDSCQYLRILNSYIRTPMWYEQVEIQSRSLCWWTENQKGKFIYATRAAEEGSDEEGETEEGNDDEENDDEGDNEELFYEEDFEEGVSCIDDGDDNSPSKFPEVKLNINPDKTELFRRNIPAISNFPSLQVNIYSDSIQEFFVACRVLEDFVCGKVVSVGFRDRGDSHERADFLDACSNWRCKSLTTLSDKQGRADKSLNHTLVTTTFRDTLPILHRLYFLNVGFSLSEPVTNLHNHHDWQRLKGAVFNYKYEDAMVFARRILDYALQLIEQAVQVVENRAIAAQEQYNQLMLTSQDTDAGAQSDEDLESESESAIEFKLKTDKGRLALSLEIRDLVLDNAQEGQLAVQSVIDALGEMDKTHHGEER